jgi:hypothetical protein
MNPIPYIKAFAWIALLALSCAFISDFWIPILIGSVVITLLIKWVTRAKP